VDGVSGSGTIVHLLELFTIRSKGT
jgi:hypothetical protein